VVGDVDGGTPGCAVGERSPEPEQLFAGRVGKVDDALADRDNGGDETVFVVPNVTPPSSLTLTWMA